LADAATVANVASEALQTGFWARSKSWRWAIGAALVLGKQARYKRREDCQLTCGHLQRSDTKNDGDEGVGKHLARVRRMVD
jgi:hypothetical protein